MNLNFKTGIYFFTIVVIFIAGSCKKHSPLALTPPAIPTVTATITAILTTPTVTTTATPDYSVYSGRVIEPLAGGSDIAYDIIEAPDHNFVLTGADSLNGIFLAKVDRNTAGVIFYRTYGNGTGVSVVNTLDGGFMIAASKEYMQHIIKTDALGNQVWAKSFTGTNLSYCNYTNMGIQLASGNYLVAGGIDNGSADYSLLEADSLGDCVWARTYKPFGYSGTAADVKVCLSGDYITCGQTGYFSGGSDSVILKADSDGDCVWSYAESIPGQDESLFEITETGAGYSAVGYKWGTSRAYMMTLSTAGVKTGEISYEAGSYLSSLDKNGGYFYMSGFSSSKAYVVKADADGNCVWAKSYKPSQYGGSSLRGGMISYLGEYVAAGYYEVSYGQNRIYIVKLNANGNSLW